MLKEQKELLALIGEAHQAAMKLYTRGVKISGVVQKLRAAGDELDARVRFIVKHSPPAKTKAAPPPKPPPAAENETAPSARPPAKPAVNQSPAGQRP